MIFEYSSYVLLVEVSPIFSWEDRKWFWTCGLFWVAIRLGATPLVLPITLYSTIRSIQHKVHFLMYRQCDSLLLVSLVETYLWFNDSLHKIFASVSCGRVNLKLVTSHRPGVMLLVYRGNESWVLCCSCTEVAIFLCCPQKYSFLLFLQV